MLQDLTGLICTKCGCQIRRNLDSGQDWRTFKDSASVKNTRVDTATTIGDEFGLGATLGLSTTMVKGDSQSSSAAQKALQKMQQLNKQVAKAKTVLAKQEPSSQTTSTKKPTEKQAEVAKITEDKLQRIKHLVERQLKLGNAISQRVVHLLGILEKDPLGQGKTRCVKHTNRVPRRSSEFFASLVYEACLQEGMGVSLAEICRGVLLSGAPAPGDGTNSPVKEGTTDASTAGATSSTSSSAVVLPTESSSATATTTVAKSTSQKLAERDLLFEKVRATWVRIRGQYGVGTSGAAGRDTRHRFWENYIQRICAGEHGSAAEDLAEKPPNLILAKRQIFSLVSLNSGGRREESSDESDDDSEEDDSSEEDATLVERVGSQAGLALDRGRGGPSSAGATGSSSSSSSQHTKTASRGNGGFRAGAAGAAPSYCRGGDKKSISHLPPRFQMPVRMDIERFATFLFEKLFDQTDSEAEARIAERERHKRGRTTLVEPTLLPRTCVAIAAVLCGTAKSFSKSDVDSFLCWVGWDALRSSSDVDISEKVEQLLKQCLVVFDSADADVHEVLSNTLIRTGATKCERQEISCDHVQEVSRAVGTAESICVKNQTVAEMASHVKASLEAMLERLRAVKANVRATHLRTKSNLTKRRRIGGG